MIPEFPSFNQPVQDFAPNAAQPLDAPIQRLAPVANMMGHSLNSENQQLDQSRTVLLANNAEIANQALRQLNNVIANTQASSNDKCNPEPVSLVTPREPAENVEDEVHLITMPSTSNLEAEVGFDPEGPLPNESLPKPAASSLVSPPASSHNDPGLTPLAPETKLTPSSSSSRHSSRHPKQVARYTPESGSTRRASSSSVADMMLEKTTPLINRLEAAKISEEVDANPKRAKLRLSSEIFTDEESLRLIKELQAQDYGLRRRGRV